MRGRRNAAGCLGRRCRKGEGTAKACESGSRLAAAETKPTHRRATSLPVGLAAAPYSDGLDLVALETGCRAVFGPVPSRTLDAKGPVYPKNLREAKENLERLNSRPLRVIRSIRGSLPRAVSRPCEKDPPISRISRMTRRQKTNQMGLRIVHRLHR